MTEVHVTSARDEWIVTGRVQGVAFRAATRRKALDLGLRGSATNRDDGSVQVVAMGEQRALDALHAWLEHGPPQAQVTHLQRVQPVERLDDPSLMPEGFDTR